MATATRSRRRKAPADQAVPHLTVAERAARGKAARAEVPRSSHAAFEPAPRRKDPIELLERQAETRVPELVPIRYGRMLVSPFTFYRGAALIMAGDLAATPRSGLTVQCCGDAHLSNFGVFASPERQLVFDVNDFDETLPGPWEWDVKRLAASMLIAARDNSYASKDQDQIVLDTVESYRTAMRAFASMKNLDVWYAHLDIEAVLAEFGSQFKAKAVRRTEKQLAKARTKDSMSAFSKLAKVVDGEPRIVADPPLIVPIEDLDLGVDVGVGRDQLFAGLHELVRSFRSTLQHDRRVLLEEFALADFARKVVGVGSVGTRAWIALLMGRDNQDPLFLQMKEAEASVLEEFLGPSEFENHGERVVAGQRLMQATSDIFLGWVHVARRRRRDRSRLLRPPAQGLEGLGGNRADGPPGDGDVRETVRLDARARTRPQRRPHRDLRLPGEERRVRPRDPGVLPAPTPSRTSATTRRSSRRSRPARSPPRPASSQARAAARGDADRLASRGSAMGATEK